MAATTLSRYFGSRFLSTVLSVFAGVFVIIALVDFLELSRRAGSEAEATTWVVAKISFFRVPYIAEILMPFAVLIGAMVCYLTLSRRLELVVARSVGISAWQFVAPALVVALVLGTFATTVYNPIAASLQEQSKKLEASVFGAQARGSGLALGFWLRQRNVDGQAIINATTTTDRDLELGGVTVYSYDSQGRFRNRIEAKTATLEKGFWRLHEARIFTPEAPPEEHEVYSLPTAFTAEQVRENFATADTVPFWQLPKYIEIADHAGLGGYAYRLQYQKLLARPFLLAAMVLLAAAVSLRFFRFGGVQKMILSGVAAGFLLYVLSKVTDDLSKANLLAPVYAAWLPVLIGGLTGFLALLYLEDG